MTSNAYELVPRNSQDADDRVKDNGPSEGQQQRSWPRILNRPGRRISLYILAVFAILSSAQFFFRPSFNSPPPYTHPRDEKVFIAANIISSELIHGQWEVALLQLVKRFDPGHVYVSVYGGPTEAMEYLDGTLSRAGIKHTVVSEEEDPIDRDALHNTTMANGDIRIKRIAYLAAVRNRALEPLASVSRYDKVLFLNDVIFQPDDALRLLFGTKPDKAPESPLASPYRAACAMDYISPFKFYDTFATRDLEGYSIGVPIFPYFSNEGDARSRKDFVEQRDLIRVKSCWGGMVAYDARFFQEPRGRADAPSRETTEASAIEMYNKWASIMFGDAHWESAKFRAESDPLYDASECCLLNADIQRRPAGGYEDDVGIYINPYVRVAYGTWTYNYLWLGKRFERLLNYPQMIISSIAGLPTLNSRRQDGFGVEYRHGEMVDGKYEFTDRIGGRGGFCETRQLLVMKEGEIPEGELPWERLEVPSE